MRNRPFLYSCAIIIFVAAAFAVRADDFWAKKQWQQWSQSDCNKMLQDSPWSRKFTMTHTNIGAGNLPSSNGGTSAASGTSGEDNEQLSYFVQLRSAMPVREALVRQMQIKQKYDSLNADQKKTFDSSAAQFLTRSYEDSIVVDVAYDCNITPMLRELARIWQSTPDNTVPTDTHLILDSGARVSPVRFVSPKSGAYEFELIFPRVVNGEPVISESSKTVGLEFPHPTVGDFPRQRVYVEFKPDKMAMNGKVVY